mgnify:CR=1 FL=1
MKKILYLLFCLLWISGPLYPQAPQAFNYQAVVRNKTGEVLKAQRLNIQISILSDNAQGPVVYQEMHATTTSDAGTISLQIGKGSPLQGKFNEIDWASGKDYFLNTAFTLNNETITLGAVQVLSVPYALYAQRSGEKHKLILENGMLSIEGGGEGVKLPSGSSSGKCLWEEGTNEIYYKGAMSLKQNNIPYLQANSDIDGVGHLRLNYKGDKSITFDQGEIVTYNSGEQPKVKITNTDNTENGGIGIWGGGLEHLSLLAPKIEGGIGSSIYMRGKDVTKRLVSLIANEYGGSIFLLKADATGKNAVLDYEGLYLWNLNNKKTVSIENYSKDNIKRGIIRLYDHSDSENKQYAYISGDGSIGLDGYNGQRNVLLGNVAGDKNSGGVWTYDQKGNSLVKISSVTGASDAANISICYENEDKGGFQIINGKSRLTTDEIYLDGYPLRASSTSYSAGLKSTAGHAPCFVSESTDRLITFRGTASLNNGQFKVVLPSEETDKIDEGSITVQVTPLSAASKGLAVIQKNNRSFTVAELMSGTGSYNFDWTLTAMIKETPQLRSNNNYKGSGPQKSE